jgi:HSP20 family protein
MALRDMVPWNWGGTASPVRREQPFGALREDMNRLFDEFFEGRGLAPWGERVGAFVPKVDVNETDGEYTIDAELPGMTEDEIDVSVTDEGVLLQGEKKHEEKKTEGGRTYTERSSGSFQRLIPLPAAVDPEKADATFKNGVLTLSLPKLPEPEQPRRTIEVKGG